MILTGKALEDFQDWYTEKYKQFNPSYVDDIHLFALIIEWLDSIGVFIHIEPHIGGGAEVFYPEVIYRDEGFIDIHEKVENTKYTPIEMYFDSRQEATKQAIIINRLCFFNRTMFETCDTLLIYKLNSIHTNISIPHATTAITNKTTPVHNT